MLDAGVMDRLQKEDAAIAAVRRALSPNPSVGENQIRAVLRAIATMPHMHLYAVEGVFEDLSWQDRLDVGVRPTREVPSP